MNTFKFYTVGQGTFYVGQLCNNKSNNPKYNFIYDIGCRGKSSNKSMNRCIDEYLDEFDPENIDMIIISHLDQDHYNGLLKISQKLKGTQCKIKKVILPYSNDFNVLSVPFMTVINDLSDETSFNFVPQINNNQTEININGFNIPAITHSSTNSWNFFFYNPSEYKINSFKKSKIVSLNSLITNLNNLMKKSGNKNLNMFIAKTIQSLPKNKNLKSLSYNTWSQILKIYKKNNLMGSGKKQNEASTILLHGPKNRNNEYTLLTGDAKLTFNPRSKIDFLTPLKNWISNNGIGYIAYFQVPHHGSKHNMSFSNHKNFDANYDFLSKSNKSKNITKNSVSYVSVGQKNNYGMPDFFLIHYIRTRSDCKVISDKSNKNHGRYTIK